jgi:hypothetical protein
MHSRHLAFGIFSLVFTIAGTVALFWLPMPSVSVANAGAQVSALRYADHVEFLASPAMQGRGNGSEALEDAAEYLADQFRIWGLEPAGEDGYFQTFEATTATTFGDDNALTLGGTTGGTTLEPMVDFAPMRFSDSGEVSSPVAFAGYGITAPEYHWDDYAGIDVEGRIVVVFRHEPQENDAESPFAGADSTSHAQLINKAINARQHGAAGILYILDPAGHEPAEEELLTTAESSPTENVDILAAYVRMESILPYFEQRGFDLRAVQREIDSQLVPRSFDVDGLAATLTADIDRVISPLRNVIASVEGSDPELRDEWVIVGAHYDHLGLDGEYSLEAEGAGQIHHGADDNASGTAGVLELARVAAAQPERFGRSLLFMGFAGEEIGLLGSNHFANDPTIPIENTAAMINLDMIGRLRDDRVYVSGVGTGSGFTDALEELNDTGLTLDYSDSGMGASDHMSFNIKEVPVLFFFSGLHGDYHRPSDTAEKIEVDGAMKVLSLVESIMERLAGQAEPPEYTRVDEPTPVAGSGGGYGPYFGSIPDFREVEGVLFADVTAGSPADTAGLASGDILVEFNGKEIRNLYDFTYALQAEQPGNVVPVAVMRGAERIEVDVALEARR